MPANGTAGPRKGAKTQRTRSLPAAGGFTRRGGDGNGLNADEVRKQRRIRATAGNYGDAKGTLLPLRGIRASGERRRTARQGHAKAPLQRDRLQGRKEQQRQCRLCYRGWSSFATLRLCVGPPFRSPAPPPIRLPFLAHFAALREPGVPLPTICSSSLRVPSRSRPGG